MEAMPWIFLALRVLPVMALAVSSSVVAAGISVDRLPAMSILPMSLIGLMLFAGLLTFRRTRGWNLGLLIGFAAVVGAVLQLSFAGGEQTSWGSAILGVVLVLCMSAMIGRQFRPWLSRLAGVLWLLSWIYLVGWIASSMLRPPTESLTIWAAAGIAVFGGVAAGWFACLSGEQAEEQEAAVSLGVDLYLISLNLGIAMHFLGSSLASR